MFGRGATPSEKSFLDVFTFRLSVPTDCEPSGGKLGGKTIKTNKNLQNVVGKQRN